MQKTLFSLTLLCLLQVTLSAQNQFQIRRIINCADNYKKNPFGVMMDCGILSDSPNRRFMPVEKELQKYLIDWVVEGKLQAYYYSENIADFSQKMDSQIFLNKMLYYSQSIADSVTFLARDLNKIGIEEVVNYSDNQFHYIIQSLILYIPKNPTDYIFREREAIARFRYKDLTELWTKTYENSLKSKFYTDLECFVQVYDDNFKTISFTEAFEKRYFNAKIEKIIPEDKNGILMKEKKYNPKPVKAEGIWYLPQFKPSKNGKITSVIDEMIDLRTENNFFKDSSVLGNIILEGVMRGKLPTYPFAPLSDNYPNYQRKNQVPVWRNYQRISFFDNQFGDSVILSGKDIYILELQSIVSIKKGKKVKFKPYQCSILVPLDRYDCYNCNYLNMNYVRLMTFKYKDIIKYLRKVSLMSSKLTFKTQEGKKNSFVKVLSQRKFKGIIRKYDTIFDQSILVFLGDIFSYKDVFLNPSYRKLDKSDNKEMERQSKLVIEYIKSLGK